MAVLRLFSPLEREGRMGLSIHYSLRSTTKSAERACRVVEQMRQIALDLPFESVGEVVDIEGDDCNFEVQRGLVDEPRLWLLIQGSTYVECPWNPGTSQSVKPNRLVAFSIRPGPGSEPANIGLCLYPSEIEWEYQPRNDVRFIEEYHPDGPLSTSWRFSWKKWSRWLERHGHDGYLAPESEQFVESRKVKTGLSGWRWSTSCKSQYSSDPQCGGIPNFLRCHISTVTLLERIGKLPTMELWLNDEGQYGPSRYSDDRDEALKEGRKPTSVWHPGKYDPKALTAEVGEWNGMIAAFFGAMKDATATSGLNVESPIQEFSNFEHLEFKGSQDEKLRPFLQFMKELAEKKFEKGKDLAE